MIQTRPPLWILKRGGLESSDQRLISSIVKTKGIRKKFKFFFWKKNVIFQDFSRFCLSALGWTGELWSNRVFLILKKRGFFLPIHLIHIFPYKWFFTCNKSQNIYKMKLSLLLAEQKDHHKSQTSILTKVYIVGFHF